MAPRRTEARRSGGGACDAPDSIRHPFAGRGKRAAFDEPSAEPHRYGPWTRPPSPAALAARTSPSPRCSSRGGCGRTCGTSTATAASLTSSATRSRATVSRCSTSWSASPRLRELLRFEADRARQLLDAGESLREAIGGRIGRAVALFARGGLAALDALESSGWDVYTQRPKPSRARLAREAVATLVR